LWISNVSSAVYLLPLLRPWSSGLTLLLLWVWLA
jgi:hypothetical protein